MLHRLRLCVEIRRLKRTPIFSYQQKLWYWCFTYSVSTHLSLTYLKKVPEICKIVAYFEVNFWGNVFVEGNQQNEAKNAHSILKTMQNHIKMHVPINIETWNSIKPSGCCIFKVTVYLWVVFTCVLHHLVEIQHGHS